MKLEYCAECGKKTVEHYTVVAMLPLSSLPIVEIEVYCCTYCDWITIDDWDRKEQDNIQAWIG